MSDDLAVQLIGIEKRFPGVIANHDVNIDVKAGSIHAIVGENGAGKSTLMKTLYGMHRPEQGRVIVNGTEQHFKSPSDAIDAGIGMVHQHFMLADNFTVTENIILGAEPRKGAKLDLKAAKQKLTEIAKSSGIEIDLDALVADLGVGQRQRVEILKVLFRGAQILILDEPTAVLVPQEVDELFTNLRQLVTDGATVIFISHKLDEVMAVSDEITVIRSGTTVTTVLPSETDQKQLAEYMVGSELPAAQPRTTQVGEAVRLEVNGVSVASSERSRPVVDDVSLTVHAGEILGVAGVEGNGQFELCQAILGLTKATGTVVLDGHDVSHEQSRARQDLGLAYIPFDRHTEGLMLDSALWENLLLTRDNEPELCPRGFVDKAAVRAATVKTIKDFDVMTPSETVPMYALSGGNQQKMLVGRELESEPAVLAGRPSHSRCRCRSPIVDLGQASRRPRRGTGSAADHGRPGGVVGPLRPDHRDVRRTRQR